MVTCDACGKGFREQVCGQGKNCNRVRVGKVDLALCYYCSHDIHEQLSLGCLWIRLKKSKDVVDTNKALGGTGWSGDHEYGSATVFDGGKTIFHQE
jgi:hypothetical protein